MRINIEKDRSIRIGLSLSSKAPTEPAGEVHEVQGVLNVRGTFAQHRPKWNVDPRSCADRSGAVHDIQWMSVLDGPEWNVDDSEPMHVCMGS